MSQRAMLSLIFVAVKLVVGVAQAQVRPTVRLTLMPDTVSPGLAPIMLLTVTNASDQPQTLSGVGTLSVVTPTARFNAHGQIAGDERLLLPTNQLDKCGAVYCLTISARGQRDLYISPAEDEFFSDRRLSFPGTYQVQMTLYGFTESATPMPPIASNNLTLSVQQPTGADAAVWQRLLQITDGKGWGLSDWVNNGLVLVPRIKMDFPSSTYAAWLAGNTPFLTGRWMSFADALADYNRALATNLPPAIHDELLLVEGGLIAGYSSSAIRTERDADKGLLLAGQARDILTQVHDAAVTEYIRNLAAKTLSELFTREQALAELRFLAENDPPALARVIPRVECVTKGAGHSFSARFAYTNPNKAIKVLQIGGNNLVSPAPVDQGQPRVFKPGDHPNVFTAASPGGNLTWHLDGGTAEATADFAVQCTSH